MNKIYEKAVWDELIPSDDVSCSISSLGYPTQPKMIVCYNCGKVIPSDSAFCPWCRIELFTLCLKCGHKYSSQYPSCNQCGTDRKEYLLQQVIFALQCYKEQEERLKLERIKSQEKERREIEERRRYEQTLPKILKLSCSPWEDENDWGIKIDWLTINVVSCHISIRKKGDNTYYPVGYSWDFPSNGSAKVGSRYFIDMLSIFRNNYDFIVELTAHNVDDSYVIHDEVEFKAHIPFYGVPKFYV